LDVLNFPIASKNVRGMWLKCGAKPRGGEPVKNGLNTGIAGILRNGKIECLLLTTKGPGPYNHHSFGAPSALRRDDAPLKLLTYVWNGPPRRSRRFKFRRLLGVPRGWKPRVSGLFDK
jgi:hypothetical protein